MLAKLSWRVFRNPNFLLRRILFEKYCSQSTFIEAQVPSTASHGWRGILVGRDLLTKGLGWAIGSGRGVAMWREPWLSTAEPLALIGPPTLATSNWCVDKLIIPGTNEWNMAEVRRVIPQYEPIIRTLIPSAMSAPDERVCYLTLQESILRNQATLWLSFLMEPQPIWPLTGRSV